MKTVLLYANEDSGLESRFQAALDLGRVFGAHLTCLQVTPFDAFVMGDPFGGIYALPVLLEELRKTEDEQRARLEQRLAGEDVTWDWLRYDGAPARIVTARSGLADMIVLSLPAALGDYDGPLAMAGDVAVHARAPVLAIPQSGRLPDYLGVAVVAWNGSAEAAHALRLTLPLLRKASRVQILTLSEESAGFPATDASRYLARHDIRSELHERVLEDQDTAEALLEAAGMLGADYIVMGAYGHSRLSETMLGGVTRQMLCCSHLPLVLAH
jgi:nucleotide-binding universal stress UspA family protein